MDFLAPVADLLGITTGEITTLLVLAVVVVVGWAILRTVIRMAVRTFATGCVVILLLGLGLYVFFVLL